MLNQNELEKVIIKDDDVLRLLRGVNLSNKHLIIETEVRNFGFGNVEGCVIEGKSFLCRSLSDCRVQNAEYVQATQADNTEFFNCKEVKLGNILGENKVSSCKFLNCSTINIEEADVSACSFCHFEILYLTNALVYYSVISDITCNDDCAISMEDGSVSNVSFENISLQNGSYLIEGFGAPWIENSTFSNICTSRYDKEIFHQEETKGIIFKRKKEYSFVDEDSCTGLDCITLIN